MMNQYINQILEYVVDEFEGYERQAISNELLLNDYYDNKKKLERSTELINELRKYIFTQFKNEDINEDEYNEKEEEYLLLIQILETAVSEMKGSN